MSEYTLAASLILVLAVVGATRTGMLAERAVWAGAAGFAMLTIAADVALTHAGVFRYPPSSISGVRIDRMPVEDLEYGIALYLVAVAAWRWKGVDAR